MNRWRFLAYLLVMFSLTPLSAMAEVSTDRPRITVAHSGIPADQLTEMSGVPRG
jgi:hypothetical protein